MEQNLRDARISTLYEGTTGIQALDLLGRKVLGSQGQALLGFTQIIQEFCATAQDNAAIKAFIEPLERLSKEWTELTMKTGMAALQNRDEAGAAAGDYLMYSGYVTLAYFCAAAADMQPGAGNLMEMNDADFLIGA